MIPELVDKVAELLKPESKEEAPASEEAKAEQFCYYLNHLHIFM